MLKYNYTQKRSDYLTPPEIYTMALKHFGIEKFNLDVCCTEKNIPAENHFINGEKDGLKEEWSFINWCNPPFKDCDKWVNKAYEEQQKGRKSALVIPVRTETKYWQECILYNYKVQIKYFRKTGKFPRFLDPVTKEPMGVYKNALSLVFFD